MGKRGPPAKPSAIKKREGTYRKDRAAAREPEPEPGAPARPLGVTKDKDARELWDALVPRLLDLKVLTIVDGTVLEGLCQAYSKAVKADRAIKQYGVVMKTIYGLKANPAVAMSRTTWAEVRRFAGEFGLSPAARTRVNAGDGGDGKAKGQDAASWLFNPANQATAGAKVVGTIRPGA